MIEIEAVVVRDKVEEVIDAVTEGTGRVGAALTDVGLPPGKARLRPTTCQRDRSGAETR